jgi:DNA-binding transcriptional ArsR family regulator
MSTTFEVLAEPSRRRILEMLQVGEQPVNALVVGLGLSQPAVSKHLRVLREAGLVRARVDGQHRVYRLIPEPLVEVDDWLTPFRQAWSRRLDALGDHLDTMEDP